MVRRYPALADVHGRRDPDLAAEIVKQRAYRKGAQVPIVCQTVGGKAYGSTIWDRTVDGFYVSDAYIATGYKGFDPNLPRCSGGR